MNIQIESEGSEILMQNFEITMLQIQSSLKDTQIAYNNLLNNYLTEQAKRLELEGYVMFLENNIHNGNGINEIRSQYERLRAEIQTEKQKVG